MLWGFSRWRLFNLGSRRREGLSLLRSSVSSRCGGGPFSVVCPFPKAPFWGMITPSWHLVGSSCERVVALTLCWFFVIVSSS
jgi:hypothetical protein